MISSSSFSGSIRQTPTSSTSGMRCPNESLVCKPGVIRLPDLLPSALLKGTSERWPCTSAPHPLKQEMTVESLDWVKSLNVMSDEKLAKFAKYEIMTLVAWAYRRASPKHFRLCADFMHLFWIIDDRTDEQPSIEVEREVANIKRVLEDPSFISPEQGVLEGVCQSSVFFTNCRSRYTDLLQMVEKGCGRAEASSSDKESIFARLHLISRLSP